MTLEEILKDCPPPHPLTDVEKERFEELCNRGWIDVADVYWNVCKKRNYAAFALETKGRWQMWKNNEPFTKEQLEKMDRLKELGWFDVIRAYKKACEEANYTEEYKIALQIGWVEGVGMDDD